ncbi:unnamed protein product [Orchesella dallaii]|uniref:Uncharacterized protein n=1 Tax=Orchesella dallaii TaxID=48710 RepID=A0ABP1RWH9_9HEXA
MIVSATNVNSNAIKILDVLRKCPKVHYHDTGVSRLEHQISSGPTISFTGLGWYYITKRFLPTIISAIFTIEIVLLQADASVPKK